MVVIGTATVIGAAIVMGAAMDGAALKEAAKAHVKAIEGMDAKGVLSQSDFASINAGLGKAIASVPTSKVMDVYNSMAQVVGNQRGDSGFLVQGSGLAHARLLSFRKGVRASGPIACLLF